MIEVWSLGLNNLASIHSALTEVSGEEVRVIESPEESCGQGLVVLPGTGSFEAGVRELDSRRYRSTLWEIFRSGNRRIFGVCLGMQLLFDGSEEGNTKSGLGFIPVDVVRLAKPQTSDERVPRVGWESVRSQGQTHEVLETLNGRDVYFSHSFGVYDFSHLTSYATTSHSSEEILAGFVHGNVAGFQFHPERSSSVGLDVLEAVAKWGRGEI